MMSFRYGLDYPLQTFVTHGYTERTADLGEVTLNYAVTGPESAPALLLVPGLNESWWGYEEVMKAIEGEYRVHAVDIRGQGRSTRTPGRYTLDNWGNDLVRFIERVIERPTIVAGSSLGGVMAAWLAAYAPPGLVRAVYLEDAPLFTSELTPAFGGGIRQSAVGFLFDLFATHLGDQWAIGDWKGMLERAPSVVPEWMLPWIPAGDEPPQRLREIDPETSRALISGTATASCSHRSMLRSVKVPMLFSHHFHGIAPGTGILQGAISEPQVTYARSLVAEAGQPFEYKPLPDKGHALHEEDPALYVSILKQFAQSLA